LRTWYGASINEFLNSTSESVLGQLAAHCDFALVPTQRDAWLAEIEILRSQLAGLSGSVFLEFNIPRMGRRIDAVIIINQVVFPIEFKIGEKIFDRSAVDQVWDYALDLKNFHEASHNAAIVPILLVTEPRESPAVTFHPDADRVYRPVPAIGSSLRHVLDLALQEIVGSKIDPNAWADAPYHPTPTIVEAARALYAQHSVEAIKCFDAGKQNLGKTSGRIQELAAEAQAKKQKVICFVTGVPGAGKTLVGLNLATQRDNGSQSTHAVFLSGNGPLVDVLREALTRDELTRRRNLGEKIRKGKVGESVKAFIQNVHHFRDDGLIHAAAPPIEHVVVFDEAQRAWNVKQTASFMLRKKKHPGFSQSEPEFLISYMDRHKDWAVIVCLVGGGQEINTGEAGIDAWLGTCPRIS
jgi:Uncharacterized conserved protein (DUF2075)